MTTEPRFWWEIDDPPEPPKPSAALLEAARPYMKRPRQVKDEGWFKKRFTCSECKETKGPRSFIGKSQICTDCVDGILRLKEKRDLSLRRRDSTDREKKKAQVDFLKTLEGFYEHIVWGNVKVSKAVRIAEDAIACDASLLVNDARTIWREIKPRFVEKEVPPLDKDFFVTARPGGDRFVHFNKPGLIFGDLLELKTITKTYEIVGYKQCWNCGVFKDAPDFIRTHDTGDGLTHTCRVCVERAAFLWGIHLERRKIAKHHRLALMPFDHSSGIAVASPGTVFLSS